MGDNQSQEATEDGVIGGNPVRAADPRPMAAAARGGYGGHMNAIDLAADVLLVYATLVVASLAATALRQPVRGTQDARGPRS